MSTLNAPYILGKPHKRLFTRLFAGLFVALMVLWHISLVIRETVETRQLISAMEASVALAGKQLSKALSAYASDLGVVSHSQSLRQFAGGEERLRQWVERELINTMTRKPDVAQLRYIDRLGREVVRVDRRGETVALIRPEDLQNKSTRYYVRHTLILPPDGLYVSPIDLNIERDQVEVPWTPMLRLATPIHDVRGQLRGLVVANIFAEDFLTLIDPPRIRRPLPPLQILNGDGFWLAGVPEEQMWGFMFARNTTMAVQNEPLWLALNEHPFGRVDMGGATYLFTTVDPAVALDDEGVKRIWSAESRWKIVGEVPRTRWLLLWDSDAIPVMILGMLLAAAIAYGWSRALAAGRLARVEKEKAEKDLMQSDRLASLGGLVAGVAHELNTPIGNAVTVATTLSHQMDEVEAVIQTGQITRSRLLGFVDDTREGLSILQHGLHKASVLIRHFKRVAVDRTSEQRRVFQVDEVINDAIYSLQPQFKHKPFTILAEINSQTPLNSYPGALGQVLINLITNAAIHGLGDSRDGLIRVSARDPTPATVEISVTDTGSGIPPDDLPRIFDPFFTTRMGDGGSGLGLSIAHVLVSDVMGGTLHARNLVEGGACFTLTLPATAPLPPDQHEESLEGGPDDERRLCRV